MTIRSDGKVGIGTTAPETFLHVGDSASGTAGTTGQKLVVATTFATVYDGTASNSWQGMKTTNADGTGNRTATGLTFDHRTSSSGVAAIMSTSAAADRADIRFITRGSAGISEKMKIDDDGNVSMPLSTVSSFASAAVTGGNDFTVNSTNVNIGSDQASNGEYTCPVAGAYMCMISFMADSGGGGNAAVSLKKNGSWVGQAAYTVGNTYENAAMFQVISCAANDVLKWNSWSGYSNIHSGYSNVTFYLLR
jgi:hypothetical protein